MPYSKPATGRGGWRSSVRTRGSICSSPISACRGATGGTAPRRRAPGAPGYAENAALASGFLETGMEMITKPFAMEALGARIRAMLEA